MIDWQPESLGNLVTEPKRRVSVHPEQPYRVLGVRLHGKGPFIRESLQGAEISASSLFRVAPGDFIYSRLFAWQGAFGVIPQELGGCFVSNEFPIYTVDAGRLDAEYLRYWFMLPSTRRTVEAACTGSTPLTRNRYNERFFKALKIPLPSLKVQQSIVAQLDGVSERLEVRRQAAALVDAELEAVLRSAFHRIIVDAPQVRMGDIAPLVRRPIEIVPDATYAELGVRSFGRGLFDKPNLRGGDLTWQKLYEIEEGDIIFSNIKAWEGALAVARPHHHGMVGSHRYLTSVPDRTRATADFLYFYLQSAEGMAQIGQASPGSADRNRTLRQRELEEIHLPVPPIERQLWFNGLQAKVEAIRRVQTAAESEAQALMPSLLHEIFTEDAPEPQL